MNRPTAFITGASSGFGMLTALELADRGYQVAACMRDLTKAGELMSRADQAGTSSRIHLYQLDVTDEAAVTQTTSEFISRFRHLDVLINNAGFALGGYTEDLPMEDWRRQLETNVFGVIAVTRAFLPLLRSQQYGKIINLSSISGLLAYPGYAPYSTSKYALEGFSEALRHELLPYGVYVVLVEPGSYQTAIWQKGMEQLDLSRPSAYKESLTTLLQVTKQTATNAGDPIHVARLITRIAAAKRPKLRYLIGRGARLALAAKILLPWTLYERLIQRILHKPPTSKS